jgi:hypothetical protein
MRQCDIRQLHAELLKYNCQHFTVAEIKFLTTNFAWYEQAEAEQLFDIAFRLKHTVAAELEQALADYLWKSATPVSDFFQRP